MILCTVLNVNIKCYKSKANIDVSVCQFSPLPAEIVFVVTLKSIAALKYFQLKNLKRVLKG